MLQHPSKYDPSIHDELDSADLDTVLPAVLKYASSRSKMLNRLGLKSDAEELVHEAITMAYGKGSKGGYRNWDKTKCPDLVDFLKGIIKSITSHMLEHAVAFPEESLFNEDWSPKDNKIYKSESNLELIQKPKTPEEELIISENIKRINDEMDKISAEDEELGLLLLCFEEGFIKTRHIAKQLNCDPKKVNNMLRRLRYRLKDFDLESNE